VYIHGWEKPERKSNRWYDLALFLPAFNILIRNGYIHFCSLEFTCRKTIVATALSVTSVRKKIITSESIKNDKFIYLNGNQIFDQNLFIDFDQQLIEIIRINFECSI